MGCTNRSIISLLIIFLALTGCASDEEKKLAHYNKGSEYFEKGDFKSARIEFKNAIQVDPDYVDALMQLGETSLKLGDAQSAFRAYSTVAEIEPDNIQAQQYEQNQSTSSYKTHQKPPIL